MEKGKAEKPKPRKAGKRTAGSGKSPVATSASPKKSIGVGRPLVADRPRATGTGNDIATQVADQRRRLDDLDRRIIDLIVERAAVVRAVARVKRTVAMDIIDVARETEIVELLRERAAGRLPEDELDNFIDALRELMQGVAMEREH